MAGDGDEKSYQDVGSVVFVAVSPSMVCFCGVLFANLAIFLQGGVGAFFLDACL